MGPDGGRSSPSVSPLKIPWPQGRVGSNPTPGTSGSPRRRSVFRALTRRGLLPCPDSRHAFDHVLTTIREQTAALRLQLVLWRGARDRAVVLQADASMPGSGLLTRVARSGIGTLVRAGYRVGVLHGACPEFRAPVLCMDRLARCTPIWWQGLRERGDELFARRVDWRPVGQRPTLYQATGHSSACTAW